MGNYRNNGNGDEEPTSGFVMPDDILWSDQFTDFSDLPSKGYSMLVRAKRHGRWWMLKGLAERYRQDTVYRVLLQKEYEIICQLQHPMVASASSLEEVEGLGLCIVMEWIDGMTLREWLAKGNHTRKQRRRVADMLMEALAYVHSRQTQHRDLKPSNIMLTHNGQYLKLIDFGLSDTDSHAILKASAGTDGYMAPDGPSDIYSLGCILRELRTGRSSRMVVRKCCASLDRRYTSVANIQRDLHRCWQWTPWMLLIVCFVIVMTAIYLPPLISRFIAQNTVQGDLQSPHSEEIISFADKHVKDICVAHWDTNGDGELSMGEAAAVRNISDAFVETSITSFDEFRFFSRVILLPEWTSFCGCMALNSIVIPANLTSISGLSFANCSSLKNISVDSVNTVYDSRSDCNAIIETATNKLVVGCKTSNIPDGITAIGNSAFWGRWDMQEMTLPETITTIEKDAFSCCTSLKAITLPASISEIGDRAFVRCDALTSVRCYMETPPAIDKDAFTNRANATLYVPKGCKAAYEAADYWKEFKVIKEF
ncbi:MAG: leucine-rich repeat protein [Prevotella sp.]|nr:leucine-rich repeat protein [Prevotella sp.]